jgi:hypothetical protein
MKNLILSLLVFTASSIHGDEYEAPTMSYGVPDLQGTWTNATATGLIRRDDIDTLVLTPEQAAEVEGQRAEFFAANDELPEDGLKAGQDVGGYNSFWMDPGTRLAVVNGEIRSSLIVEPKDGKVPYSIWGYLKVFRSGYRMITSADNPEQRALGERCIVGFGSTGGPPMLPVLYNNNYQIVQSPGYVMILVEMNHDARIIRMGGDPLPDSIKQWMGDSIGHWEGDTLVVETTNFNPGQSFRASLRHFIYLSETARVTERFTRIGEKEILYEFSIDDPDVYTQVWKAEIPMLASEGRIYEYACHEGNYSLPGILAGARRED